MEDKKIGDNKMAASRVYLALGDSMSIDDYTGVTGGGAVNQLHRWLGSKWTLDDRTVDGCCMSGVPTGARGELITLTIGGNDLLVGAERYLAEGVGSFAREHLALLRAIRGANPDACFLVGNVYAPQWPLLPEWEAGLDDANAAIAHNAAEVGARLIDIRETFRGRERELLCLEIEPNLAGATAIAGLFRDAARAAGVL